MKSLHSDGSATYLLIIWTEKNIPLAMKSKQKPYPSIVFLSIFCIQYVWMIQHNNFLNLRKYFSRGPVVENDVLY